MSDKSGVIITSVGGNYPTDAPHELAWQHTQALAEQGQFEFGTDEFVEIYNDLAKQYQICLDHSGFIQFMSMRVLRELFRTGEISLVVTPSDGYSEVSDSLSRLSHIITSAIMYMLVLEEKQWVPDEEWNLTTGDDRSVYFPITIPEVKDDTDN
jgi:hypothetical protein